MVAIGTGGLSPARFLSRILAWLRAPAFAEHDHEAREKRRHYPPQRASFVEQASMSREMFRL
jgi:hypoxanthine phosphoribosyltransferase